MSSEENKNQPEEQKDEVLPEAVPNQPTEEPKVEEPPKEEPPKVEEPPKQEPPKQEPPKQEPPKLSKFELINQDPSLKSYEWAIERRCNHYKDQLNQIEKK